MTNAPITMDIEGVTVSTELNRIGDIEVIVTDHRHARDHKYVINVQYTDVTHTPQVRILASSGIVRVLRAIKVHVLPSHKE